MIAGMTSAGEPVPAAVDPARLWGLANGRLDLGLTMATVAMLAASRFALLASGPWEWDETLFARGMLDFSLAAHFPQPPGFPGLLALGHLLLPLAGTPYLALQLVSALASILVLWPLAVLGRRVAPPAVATAAALLVLFLPGPWLFSVRGFSSMAAVALALAAAALLAGGLHGRRATGFTLLLTASFLVRPILLPSVALLWLVLHSIPQRRGTYLAIAGASSTIGIAGLLGGWQLVGTALGLWAGVQIAPAVWSAFRTKGQLAIAPGLWMVGLGQALLWGYYGHAVGDGALVIYGVAMGTGSAAILVRFATIRVRLRGQGETTKTMTSSQPGVAAVLMKDPAEAF